MAGLYNRVAARGFPARADAGMTGVASLADQGAPQDPVHGQAVAAQNVSTIPGFTADTVGPVGVTLLEGAFGLPGGVDLDRTPSNHAAPVPGWAGSYSGDPDLYTVHENSAQIHAADFGDLTRRTSVLNIPEPTWEQWQYELRGDNLLQPVEGQLRAMGGFDTTQGYDLRNRYGFDAGHRDRHMNTTPQPMSYLDPAERVYVVPQASGSFTPTDERTGPGEWWSGWDGTAVNATDPQPYQPPIEPSTNTQALAGAPASAGWFQ